MKDFYRISIEGLERDLPFCKLDNGQYIAAFVLFGDVELTMVSASALIKKLPKHDVLITAEAKGIPLVFEMARQLGGMRYLVARKSPKLYMCDPLRVEVESITTRGLQTLYLGQQDAEYLQGKRAVIVDDVISTGESLLAVENLVQAAGGTVVGKMAILAEGEAKHRNDITFLQELPIFDQIDVEGEVNG